MSERQEEYKAGEKAAGQPRPTVKAMVYKFLTEEDYDGLCNPDLECGCKRTDLIPCEKYPEGCLPGFARYDSKGEYDGIYLEKEGHVDKIESRHCPFCCADKEPELGKSIAYPDRVGCYHCEMFAPTEVWNNRPIEDALLTAAKALAEELYNAYAEEIEAGHPAYSQVVDHLIRLLVNEPVDILEVIETMRISEEE